jgi:NitT/TauT family transport system substrate-binding protein
MIAERPDAVRRFLAGWYETIAFARANKAEAIRYSRPVTGLSEALAEKVYDIEMPTFSADGRFDPVGLEAVKQALVDLGQLKEKPDTKALVTEEFLPKAM